MKIFSNFESGNIHIVSADSPDNIQLTIPADNQSEISQWFHFRLESEPQQQHQFSILNLPNRLTQKDGRTTMSLPPTIGKNGFVFRRSLMAIP